MTDRLTEAAVLVPVIEDSGGPAVVFIVRTDFGPHAGEVAFPGGVRDEADASFEDAALREFEEELGVPRSEVTVARTLPAHETRVSGFRVTPVLARLQRMPTWRPDPREVEDVLVVPLPMLRDPTKRGEMTHPEGVFPCIHIGTHVIWGLTYRILVRALSLLES